MSGDTALHSAAVRPDSFAEASSLRVMSPSRAARLEPVVSISAPRLAIRASMSSRVRAPIPLQDTSVRTDDALGPFGPPVPGLFIASGVVAVHRPFPALVDDRQGGGAPPPPLGRPERLGGALREPVQDPVDGLAGVPGLADPDPHPVEVLCPERPD